MQKTQKGLSDTGIWKTEKSSVFTDYRDCQPIFLSKFMKKNGPEILFLKSHTCIPCAYLGNNQKCMI